jgi:hypothetical protein
VIGRALSAVTCGESTIDLEREINAKKIIIFELSGRFGPGQGPAFGRLILAMLKAMALRRDEEIKQKVKIVPVHVFIDECHNYVTASIKGMMREARKYQVILTLTQTEVGAEMPAVTREAVIGGSKLKIAGRAGDPHPVARLLGVPEGEIRSLRRGEFIVRGDAPHAIRFKANPQLADNRHSMSEAQWARVWKRQQHTYYRSVETPVPAPEVAPPQEAPKKRRKPPEDENIF